MTVSTNSAMGEGSETSKLMVRTSFPSITKKLMGVRLTFAPPPAGCLLFLRPPSSRSAPPPANPTESLEMGMMVTPSLWMGSPKTVFPWKGPWSAPPQRTKHSSNFLDFSAPFYCPQTSFSKFFIIIWIKTLAKCQICTRTPRSISKRLSSRSKSHVTCRSITREGTRAAA